LFVAAEDTVSVARWLAFYVPFVVVAGGLAVAMLAQQDQPWAEWKSRPVELLRQTPTALKMLVLLAYLSLCCTFVPLPTGWIAAAFAAREAGTASDAVTAALLVGSVGAVASMIANLHDYHLMTWLLRRRGVARVRNTRLYNASARWFSRSPFAILVVFNIVLIPVDVIRMLATTYRYGRMRFAASNFIGRFIRYGVIAYVTYECNLGKWAAIGLLGLAVALGMAKAAHSGVRKLMAARARGTAN
jgi:membrane protein YqaA with SNARE-associated domain